MFSSKSKMPTKPFLEKVATFDLERYYTPRVRFFCHLLMWVAFTTLLQFNLFLDAVLPFYQAFAFAMRSLLCNLAVFYLFFYVAVPNTLMKNRPIAAFLSFIGCIYIWMIMNHYLLIFIARHFDVQAPYYTRGLQANIQNSLWYILSPQNFFVSLVPVFYSISPFFFTKIVFSITRFYSKLFSWERKAVNLEVEKLNLEKDFLKSQLNPHFLFNTLNNIYGLSLIKDDQAPRVVAHLSEMMRYTLYESNVEKVPVGKELQHLKNYVMLEKMRYNDNARIDCNIDDTNANHHFIAPLLTFTFVENGFKYGLKKKNRGFLNINISVDDNIFYFSIVNDKEEKVHGEQFGGIGIENAKKRLDLLYPGKHTLDIEDRGGSFSVKMTINLN